VSLFLVCNSKFMIARKRREAVNLAKIRFAELSQANSRFLMATNDLPHGKFRTIPSE
jgi:hypothetical protein